jgi:ribokinase
MSAAIVFGSLNLDYVVRLPHTPNGGETVTATELALVPGGKGANQAVALARMGTVAQLIGCTGDDAAGEFVRNALAAERIGLEGIRRVAEMPTGSAFIFVEPSGQNRIAVVPGANAAVGERELERLAAALPGAQALLLQLEVPLDAVVRAARSTFERS